MRRISAALVAIAATIALVALAAPTWAAKPQVTSKGLAVSPSEVSSGQTVRISGGGCRGITVLIFYIDGQPFHHGMTKSGDWSFLIKLPTVLRVGSHELRAQCRGGKFHPTRFHVSRRASFHVSPETAIAGTTVRVVGKGCRSFAHVVIRIHGRQIGEFNANKRGKFHEHVQLPKNLRKGHYVVTARCGGRHIGSDGIKIKKKYRHHRNHLSTDRSVVQPGKKLTVRGDDCPDGLPTASLDGAPVALNVASRGKGFTATATVPNGTAPGKHKFFAGCDAGSAGTTELNVLDPDSTDTAAARQAFGPQPSSDLAMWAGLFAGLALLVASAVFTTRRRANRG